jgi:hypothetical protein
MLLQLENTSKENINKLLAFANKNDLKLSVIDENQDQNFLPGKPLTAQELTRLIESSRKSGMISLTDAHQIARKNFNAD